MGSKIISLQETIDIIEKKHASIERIIKKYENLGKDSFESGDRLNEIYLDYLRKRELVLRDELISLETELFNERQFISFMLEGSDD